MHLKAPLLRSGGFISHWVVEPSFSQCFDSVITGSPASFTGFNTNWVLERNKSSSWSRNWMVSYK